MASSAAFDSGRYGGEKAWIERQMIIIIKAAMHGRPAKIMQAQKAVDGNPEKPEMIVPALPRNHALALSALMSLAKLKGYIVDKKQGVSAKLDLSKLPPAQLQAVLTGHLNELDPAARQQIEAIAAGEFEADFESLETPESAE